MRTITSAALAALAAICSLPVAVDGASPVRIVLNVVDYVHMSPMDGWQTEHRTRDILAPAGLAIVWRQTTSLSRPADATILLLSKRMSGQQQAAEVPEQRLLGLASPEPARRIWVHVSAVVDEAALLHTSTGALLGHVISHETLHVLARLPHTVHGLMSASPRLGREGIDDTLTNQEVRVIASALRAGDEHVTLLARQP